ETMRSPVLTPKQLETFQFIKGFIERHGYSPSLAEIGRGRRITSQGAQCVVAKLERYGVISRVPDKHRSIVVIDWPTESRAAA
ncbi:MAG: hypothetical protein WBX25_27285, partial [Rhodomicrobium sp.]